MRNTELSWRHAESEIWRSLAEAEKESDRGRPIKPGERKEALFPFSAVYVAAEIRRLEFVNSNLSSFKSAYSKSVHLRGMLCKKTGTIATHI